MLTGGHRETSGSSTPYVELYSPNGMCNYALANLPTDIYAHTFSLYYGKVFSCLGYSVTYGHSRDCYSYDIASNTWSYMTSSSYTHTWLTGQIYKNQLYFFDSPYPETYDLSTNKWSTGIYIPTATGENPCLVNYLDSVIVIGGSSNPTVIQQYNFTSKTWSSLASPSPGYSYFGCTLLPASPDSSSSALLFTDRILMMQSTASDVQGTIFDISENQFLPISPTTYGHRHNQILSLGRRVFVFAGFNGAANNFVEEYHQHNNSWTVAPFQMIYPRFNLRAVAVPAHWFKNISGGCLGVI